MTDSHWQAAIQTARNSKSGIYGPQSFRDYITDIGQDPRDYRTAAEISIDKRRDLASELEQNDMMVLRLGRAPDGTGTQFALVEAEGGLDDFFIDEATFDSDQYTELDLRPESQDAQNFAQQTQDRLRAYQLLPQFSESSLVNLALTSGLVSRTLGLDVETVGAAPATVASTFEFEFQPHPATPVTLRHNNGQVEVDACFVSRRNGKRVLIVLEAKTGTKRSLAKHKLFYPLMSLQSEASNEDFEIIPVYLRAQEIKGGIDYHIYECTPFDGEKPVLSSVRVDSHSQYRLRI
ncbi:DUF6997 domain-containing protein [Halohasta litorea]|uniref:DUF6997 domain-containing protein n=1 Tax=Halohasta litorea TaxID=869891 RepID=A0ABD6DBV9_9EURY|nr:hypothetical protein [Halohasta litorea]